MKGDRIRGSVPRWIINSYKSPGLALPQPPGPAHNSIRAAIGTNPLLQYPSRLQIRPESFNCLLQNLTPHLPNALRLHCQVYVYCSALKLDCPYGPRALMSQYPMTDWLRRSSEINFNYLININNNNKVSNYFWSMSNKRPLSC